MDRQSNIGYIRSLAHNAEEEEEEEEENRPSTFFYFELQVHKHTHKHTPPKTNIVIDFYLFFRGSGVYLNK